MNRVLLGALRECRKKVDVEDVFNKWKIVTKAEKISYLIEVMGRPEMFFSIGEPTEEQKYELTLEMFLTMTWKYSELCRCVKEGVSI